MTQTRPSLVPTLRSSAAGLLVALATLGVSVSANAEETARAPVRQITVTGTGEARAKPDLALSSLTVLRVAPTAAAALADANKAMSQVIEAMKALKIESRDLQTSGFQITPQYRYDTTQDGTQAPPELVGYEVRNSLSVRIRDLATVGSLLDRAVTLGVNEGNGIQFTIDDPAPLRSEARRKAVEDARATALALAEAAGVTLGPVVSIDVPSDAMPPLPAPMQMTRMAMAAPKSEADTAVETGENTVSVNVRMVFTLLGGS